MERRREMLLRKALWILVAIGLSAQMAFAAEDDPILGKVGDYLVKKSDLDRLIHYYPPDRQKMLQESPDQMVGLVQRMLEVKILSDLAKKEDLDKKPDVKEQLQYLANNYLAQEYIFRVVVKDIRVPDDEIKKFYDANEKSFVAPEQVRVRHILIRLLPGASDEDRKKTRENAEVVLKRLKEGEDFVKLAQEYSEDPGSRQSGGDLGYFGKGQVVKPFEEAAFSLKVGQTSDLVETQFGFHILKVEDLKPATNRPLEEVKDAIKARLQDEQAKGKVDEFINKVMMEAKTEVYPDRVVSKPKKD